MEQHPIEKKKWKFTKLHANVSENPRYTEIIFTQSGAELRIQDGAAYKSATMLEKSIGEDLGSISMAPKMSRNFKINTLSCGPNGHGVLGCPKASWDNDLIGNY